MTPTNRVYGLLLLGGAIATGVTAFSEANGRLETAIAALLLFNGLLLVLMLVDSRLGRTGRVQVTRQPLHRLSIGRDNPIVLNIKSGNRQADLRLYDNYPSDFKGIPLPYPLTLPPDREEEVHYTVTPQHRGEFTWGDIQVQQRSPWGLVWSNWTVPCAQTVAVYPDLIGLRSLSIRLALQSTGSIRQKQRIGIGTEFAELREYGSGDDLRFIDWKATARRSQPLIRVLEPEREQTLIILLDRGRLMTARVKGLNRFDWGLNATLSLALAGIRRSDRVGIGVFDRNMHTWIAPTRGEQHLQRIIETLTPIQPVFLESDYLGAVSTVVKQQHRRALVVVITDIVDSTASAELLSALMRLRPRYLPFAVTLRDPQVDVQAHTFQPEVVDAYSRAVALDLLAQRQVAFTRLKQAGVMVLDAPANQMTEPLVDAYLRVKTKSRL